MPADADPSTESVVRHYHQRTKHDFGRYAASLGYLDWATQPDPFRTHAGARRVALPHRSTAPAVAWDDVVTGRAPGPQPLDLATLGDFLRHALGLSAWKQHGSSRWALRVNPSSGNLHPVEGHVVLPPMEGVSESAVVAHHAPEEHALEVRAELPAAAGQAFARELPPGSFLVALSVIAWRESWKYGERAFRYCQHDTGHALAALSLSAGLFGWRLTRLPEWPTTAIAALLGLPAGAEEGSGALAGTKRAPDPSAPTSGLLADEHEEAQVLAVVHPAGAAAMVGAGARRGLVGAMRCAAWQGLPNRLSGTHVADWPIIDAVTAATRSAGEAPASRERTAASGPPPEPRRTQDARQLLIQRRSAMALDGRTGLALADFARIVGALMPGPHAPWTALPFPPAIHLALFVHRVEGLAPGIHLLVRHAEAHERLRASLRPGFAWKRSPGIPADLPLFLLAEGDVRQLAARLSCDQDIAADGAFSFGMLADFDRTLSARGPHAYRELFWETGVIGQVAYLEAEAAGIRGTGIGCYHDDPVHQVLGIQDDAFVSLYHFTLGGPLEDTRLTTLPGYPES